MYENSIARKRENGEKIIDCLALKPSDSTLYSNMLIHVKMPTIVGIFTLMSKIKFMLS